MIRERQAAQPRPYPKTDDIEHIQLRFAEEFERSLLDNCISLDTSTKTPQETLEDFVRQMEPYWTQADRLRRIGLS